MRCTSAVENSALQIVCLGPCVLDQCNSAMCRIVLWVAAVQIVHQGGGGCAPKGEYQTMQLSAARSFGGTHCSTSLFWYWQHYPKLFLCGGRKIFEPADKAFYQSCNFAIVRVADNSGLRTLKKYGTDADSASSFRNSSSVRKFPLPVSQKRTHSKTVKSGTLMLLWGL